MAIYGYARISTKKQSIDRQIRNIKNYCPDAIIIVEVFTGRKQSRPEWNRYRKKFKSGDMIIFDSVSRMSRNAEEGFEEYQKLYHGEIELVFLKEMHINTATYKKALENNVQLTGTTVDYILEGVNRYLMALAKEQIKIAFDQAEKEVSDLSQRTKEGLQTAKIQGKQIGRIPGKKVVTKKSIIMKKSIIKYSKDFDGTLKDVDVIKITGISKNTYYKYKRELLTEYEEGSNCRTN